MLSAYEQERLDNIARNQAYLDAIGLGEDKPALIPKKKVTKRSRDDTDGDEGPTEPTRKSSRVANLDPEHGQLTDEFCIAEERGLLRSKRAKVEPVKAYSEIQAEEDAARREASLQRASAKRKVLEDAERQRAHRRSNRRRRKSRSYSVWRWTSFCPVWGILSLLTCLWETMRRTSIMATAWSAHGATRARVA